jgi:hypothetical protein
VSINQYPEWIKCNELNAIQSQELIALKERIKRLEEAGDAMERFLPDGSICDKVANLWRKAKEAKP